MAFSQTLVLIFTISCYKVIEAADQLDCTIKNNVTPPNFLFILTDDQDVTLNGMIPMKHTQRILANEGVTFTNAFTSSPICCPSRASILSGQYAHNHLTKNNSKSGGCYDNHWIQTVEPKSLPVLLQNNGYETFFAGKYLNEYNSGNVPPGYNQWYGLNGNSKYFNYTITENGSQMKYESKYLTDLLKEFSLNFLNNQTAEKPFFAMISPPAAHAPFIPATRHEKEFSNVNLLLTPNFNVASGELDKHWLLRMPPATLSQDNIENLRQTYVKRWQTLLAVDELISDITTALETKNLLHNTYIIFTSDNGFHLGQFAQGADKRQPYETDIRVPFIVRGPKIKGKSIVDAPILLIDLFPTILDLAVIAKPNYLDGTSLVNLLFNQEELPTKREMLIEYWGEGNSNTYNPECSWNKEDRLYGCDPEVSCHCQDSLNNTYTCLRSMWHHDDRLYCEFNDKESFAEAYDLTNDPYQMDNLAFDMLPSERTMYNLALSKLATCAADSCKQVYY